MICLGDRDLDFSQKPVEEASWSENNNAHQILHSTYVDERQTTCRWRKYPEVLYGWDPLQSTLSTQDQPAQPACNIIHVVLVRGSVDCSLEAPSTPKHTDCRALVCKMQARRPSVSSRLSFAISNVNNAELGEPDHGPAVAADHQIEEEIAEIKRYEVQHPVPSPSTGLDRQKLQLTIAPRTSRP